MSNTDIERRLLEAIEQEPDTTQADLATQLNVAVGSVNWYLKRLIRKGYIKVTQLQRRKLRYFVTPTGLALKAHLTSQYLEASLYVFRELRHAARQAVLEVKRAGYGAVRLDEQGEAAEIFRLTCMELGVQVAASAGDERPAVSLNGMQFVVDWPAQGSQTGQENPTNSTEVAP